MKRTDIEDVAETLAYLMSQEKVMAVPPVLIPTEGVSSPRKRPKKQPRNKYYTQKDPKETQSTSDYPEENITAVPEEFPIKRSDEIDVEDCRVVTFEDLEAMING